MLLLAEHGFRATAHDRRGHARSSRASAGSDMNGYADDLAAPVIMKIVVIGGTGLIGSKLVAKLAAHGHDAVPASPGTGVNTLTGEGLTEALTGADVVVDVSNSPSFEDTAVLEFFEASTLRTSCGKGCALWGISAP
jgi:D-arabinose 5-phosphate isomerase GutQ